MMNRKPRRKAFTIVEMLVVIGVIALLLGLLLPALSGVQKRSRKLQEINDIRQVGIAWQMYANSHSDAALPGYLEHTGSPTVQDQWRVRYEYPSPPNPSNPTDLEIPQEIAAPWTWRLAQYFGYSPDLLWGYRGEAVNDVMSLVHASSDPDRPQRVAYEPAFGYNAYYVGGWWQMTGGTDDVPLRARTRFWDATEIGSDRSLNVVVRTVSTIERPSELVTFCSSTQFDVAGIYDRYYDDQPGSHVVMPPTLGSERLWISALAGGGGGGGQGLASAGGGGPYSVQTIIPDVSAPAPRHGNLNAVLFADGSTSTESASALYDQRRWIDRAKTRDFSHTGN